jgi:hypothetical protein
MGQTAKATRANRTITVDFHDEATYDRLLDDTKAFVEFILAFLLSTGFQLFHKASCTASGRLTRHSHYARVRLGGLTIWRVQCTTCQAVFTVLPHFRLALSPYEPRRGQASVDRHPRGTELRMVRRDLEYLAHGALSRALCLWAAAHGACVDAV